MSTPKVPPIPPRIWTRVLRFLADGCTGEIRLRVYRGQVLGAFLTEDIDQRAERRDGPGDEAAGGDL